MRILALLLFMCSTVVWGQSQTASVAFSGPAHPPGLFGPAFAIADFNGDGHPDMATGTVQEDSLGMGAVVVTLGSGKNNSYGPQIVTSFPGRSNTFGWADTVTAADVNGDGKPDLIAYNRAFNKNFVESVTILLGNGDGTFRVSASYPASTGINPNSTLTQAPLVVADFDHDGRPDIAISNRSTGNGTTIDVLLGNGDGTFRATGRYPAGAIGTLLFAVDFDHDGNVDLLSLGSDLYLLKGTGDGRFAEGVRLGLNISAIFNASQVVVADLNGDGNLDFALAGFFPSDGLLVFLGRADGTFAPAVTYKPAAVDAFDPLWGGAVFGFGVADMNGDGRLDLVLAVKSLGKGGMAIFRGNGDGTFQASLNYELDFYGLSFAIADMNQDGRPDLIFDRGDLSVFVAEPGPRLGMSITHQGEFSPGTPLVFSVVVKDVVGDPLQGTVRVGQFPSGSKLSGPGWNCPDFFNYCTRNDPLAPAASYPPLTVAAPIPDGATSLAFRPFAAGGGSETIFTAQDVGIPVPQIASAVNAASFVSGGVAPGEVVTILGSNLGPPVGIGLSLDSHGLVSTSLAGVTVDFLGKLAPLLYVSATQINCVIPYEALPGGGLRVNYGINSSTILGLPIVSAAPGIFTTDGRGVGPAAALNEDGSFNGPLNPAARGTIVTFFLTGEGQTNPSGITGQVTAVNTSGIGPLTPQPALILTAKISGQPAEIVFYGEAPGLVAGVLQVNARIPLGIASGPASLSVSIDGHLSQPQVTVSVQ